MKTAKTNNAGLNRVVTLPFLVLYGLGTILGAGIYILISKIAFHANIYTPLSFLVAGIVVAFTAFVYAELSSRFPKSAGEAAYVSQAFNIPFVTLVIGLLIAATGIVSSATIVSGFTGYLNIFFDIEPVIAETLLVIILGFIAFWGISESIKIASLMTVIEIIGLLIVIFVSIDDVNFNVVQPKNIDLANIDLTTIDLDLTMWSGIFAGAFLAFYAFIGFEDMVNIAEEVVEPKKNMPKGIIIVLLVSMIFYMMVAVVAVFGMPMDKLLVSTAPFSDIVSTNSNVPIWVITLISLFAVVNGALIQIIMASRLFYGMSKHKVLPAFLSDIHPTTRVPHKATALVAASILLLTLLFELESLAKLTSYIVVIVFIIMNVTLIVVKLKEKLIHKTLNPETLKPEISNRAPPILERHSGFTVPLAIPVIGLFVLVGFLMTQFL